MSTRCRIGIEHEDGSITSIYCHNDGYPSAVGKTLEEKYQTPDVVEELVSLGDISILGEYYNKDLAEKYWRETDERENCLTPEEWTEIYQHRLTIPYKDRSNSDDSAVEARSAKSIKEFFSHCQDSWADYSYLFQKNNSGEWTWNVWG